MFDRSQLKEGMHVKSADGHSLGKIVRLDADSFIIEKGLFFPKEYVARYDRVGNVKDGEVFLMARGEELKGERTTEEKKEYAGTRPAGHTEETRIPLTEEELVVQKKVREAGEVHVEKHVVTEQKQVTVPVTREEVHVERVAATPGAQERAGEGAFEESVTTIPVREEEVEVTKRPVVKEELRVSKEVRPEERRYAEEVRKENAEIKEKGDLEKKFEEPK